MTMQFYTGKTEGDRFEKTFPFEGHETIMTVERDGEWRDVPNPAYVPHAGMEMSNGNALGLMQAFGLPEPDGEPVEWPINEFISKVERAMTQHELAANEYVQCRGNSLLLIAYKGKAEGANVMVAS
jgi:hypothetical protein